MRPGQYIYSVESNGTLNPYIVSGVDNVEDVVFIISIHPAKWNNLDRMVVKMDDIHFNCFAEEDAFPNNDGDDISGIKATYKKNKKNFERYKATKNFNLKIKD
jgi:hypothetical protein